MAQILGSVSKLVPSSKGLIQTSVTGIGFDSILKVADNFIGSPMQKFGFSVPIMGRLSLVDVLNYLVHNKGKIMPSKDFKGVVAVGSAKLVQTGFNVSSLVGSKPSADIQGGGI